MPTVTNALFPYPPRIRLRVGVSGHRVAPKLPDESVAPVRALVDRVLATIVATAHRLEQDYATSAAAAGAAAASVGGHFASEFVVVSSLAEGADRIVAEAGLAAGFALEVVLPLARSEYAHDFHTPASRETYERLLGSASSIFELDGAAEERERAYEAAGFVMLAHVDVLIAIWDGKDAAGIGGTAQIVSRAIAGGIPIVWIEPEKPAAMRISWPQAGELPPANASARPQESFRTADEQELARTIEDIIALPKPPAQHSPAHTAEEAPHAPAEPSASQCLQIYLAEHERRWNFCLWYPLLLLVFRVRSWRPNEWHLPPALPETQKQWAGYLALLPDDRALRPAIEKILLPEFSAADHLAIYYSLVYRSAYIFNFIFAALAVMVALLGLFAPDAGTKSYFVLVEFAIIFAIVVTWYRGRRRQWHRRWLDYRRLADSLRHMRILAPIGSEGPVDRPGRKLEVDDDDWVNWYTWSLRRLLPLPDHFVNTSYLAKILAVVQSEITEQIAYHDTNTTRMGRLDHRLHFTGQIVSASTLAVGLLFLLLAGLGYIERKDVETLHVFTLFSALLPTLGAALSAIHVQGDFRTVAEQSARTEKRLQAIQTILTQEPVSFARLADRVEKASDFMMADLLEWQTVFRTRPLAPPT